MQVRAELVRDTFGVTQQVSVEVLVRCDRGLAGGDRVQVQFPNSWYMIDGPSFTRELQTADPAGAHYVTARADGDVRLEVGIRPHHLNNPEGSARHGRLITATIAAGEVPPGQPVRIVYANTTAPYVAETETVFVRVNDTEAQTPPAIITTPLAAATVRIIVPSGVRPAEPFDVLIVSLDRFDNCSATHYAGRTLTRNDGQVVAEGLTFTGSTRVPVSIEAEGVYRFAMDGALSNAVAVAADAAGPYWGDIHIHTKLSGDAMGTDPYDYCRDVAGLDFAAVADHVETLGQAGYEQVMAWARRANRPGEFAAILADERNPAAWTGHHNAYFRDEQAFLAHRHFGGKGEADLAGFDPAAVMVLPHHTGMAWRDLPPPGNISSAVDFDAVDDRGMRPVMEIYSHHGQSELYAPQHFLAYEVSRMRNPERRANTSVPGPFYAQDYWMAGRRLGVIASSDDHTGRGGRPHGGIAAVFAERLTPQGVFDAIRARRCYGTTGERMLLEFTVDGAGTGQQAARAIGSKLPVRLAVWGTELLLRVDVLRYRFGVDAAFVPILSSSPRPESTDAAFELEDEFTGPCVYYARAMQEPLAWPAMAWSSPIWIDHA